MSEKDQKKRGKPEKSGPRGTAGGVPKEAKKRKKKEIDVAREQLAEKEDQLLRLAADYDNYRKRAERDMEEMGKYAGGELISELLVILDDIERALEAGRGEGAPRTILEGLGLIHKHLCETMGKHGLAKIECSGKHFDPAFHEAVIQEESGKHADGEIIGEIQAGYTLHDRVIRASKVKVAKAKELKEKDKKR
jgi:molecular chaperone GrpE